MHGVFFEHEALEIGVCYFIGHVPDEVEIFVDFHGGMFLFLYFEELFEVGVLLVGDLLFELLERCVTLLGVVRESKTDEKELKTTVAIDALIFAFEGR